MTDLEPATSPTERTRLRRKPDRGSHERAVINEILDEGVVGQLAFAIDGRPWTVPMLYGRVDDLVYLHGSAANHALRGAAGGIEVCLGVTLFDGLVLARSAFHMSMNYRSVMIFGTATRVDDPKEKDRALTAVVEHVVPGRTADIRAPTERELATTLVLALGLEEASAKVRTGGPIDETEDLGLPAWAGVIPLTMHAGRPIPDEHVQPGNAAPAYASSYRRPQSDLGSGICR